MAIDMSQFYQVFFDTGVMIADNARNIIYVNKSAVDILGKAEADIRKQLPNFSAVNLMGTNIDTLLVEEAAAAAESLEEQAQNLSQSVSVFKLDSTGSRVSTSR